jgi:putative MATE family efflux protein
VDKRRQAILYGPLWRHVFLFGMPLALAMGLQACFNLADLFIIGKLPNGTEAIAALVTCDMIAVIGTIFVQGLSNAAVAVISRFFGQGERHALNHTTWNSIYLVTVASVIYGAIGYFGAEFLVSDMVATKGAVREIAVSYLQILVGHSWTIFFLLHLTALMRAIGSAKWPAIILIGANLLNIFLDVLMVYGPGPAPDIFSWGPVLAETLGIPRMGVDGAAWATVIARGVGCLAALVLLTRMESGPRLVRSELRPQRSELWRLVRIGTPSSAQFLVRIGAVLVGVAVVTRMYTTPADPTVMAAYSICIRLDMLALFQGLGWASAAQTFVGANLGGDRPARAMSAGWVASAMNAVAMSVLALIFVVFANSIIGIFDDTDAVLAVGREYLRIVAGTYAFIGVAVVLSHAFQGATATVTSFVIDSIVIVGFQIPLLLVLGMALELPRTAVWFVIGGANVLSALVYAAWYVRGTWVSKTL